MRIFKPYFWLKIRLKQMARLVEVKGPFTSGGWPDYLD